MGLSEPALSNLQNIRIHTGNIVDWSRQKKTLTQSPSELLSQCISSNLDNLVTSDNGNVVSQICKNDKFIEQVDSKERDGLKLTVKIFLLNMDVDAIKTAVDMVLDELQTDMIETVILSVPEDFKVGPILSYWRSMENLIEGNKVRTLGISNLNKDQLENLYNNSRVKPSLNQVNVSSCCVIPPDLSQFAKDHDIQLTTHNDATDILPDDDIQQILSEKNFTDVHEWKTSWVTRYNIFIKDRGIIHSKCYIVDLERTCKD